MGLCTPLHAETLALAALPLTCSAPARRNTSAGLSETGQTGPTFLRVRSRGPFDTNASGEAGIPALKQGQGQARGIFAVSNGAGGVELTERAFTSSADRQGNMLVFASRALALLERAMQQKPQPQLPQGHARL